MLERRLQILLDEDRYERVAAVAKRRGISVARVIRDAIDALLPSATPKKAAAGRRILSAGRMPVSSPKELKKELDELRARRA